jgi:hypothetical protein
VYDSDNYIIAAIVVGEDSGSTDNYIYAIKGTQSEWKDGDTYYWDFQAVVNGKITTLTVKEKSRILYNLINNSLAMNDYSAFKVTYDADGYVTAATAINQAAAGTTQKLYDINDFQASTLINQTDGDYKVYDVYHTTAVRLYAVGRTLYADDGSNHDVGVTIAADAPVVVIEERTTGTKYEEYTTIKQALSALGDSDNFHGHVAAILNGNGTAQFLVLKSTDFVTETVDDGTSPAPTGVTLVSFNSSLRTITVKKSANSTDTDIANAVKNALADNGYTWDTVTVSSGVVTACTAFYTSSSNNATPVNFTVTVNS